MQSRLFRSKTVERISSPEQLQDYMRVTNPGIWMVLAAVIVLLAGLLVASALVKVETTVRVKGVIDEADNDVVMEIAPQQGEKVREGMTVRLADRSGQISYIYEDDGALRVSAELDDGAEALPRGTYDVEIVTETLSPISFLLN